MTSIMPFLRRKKPMIRRSISEGHRIYAVGDIHGRADLFDLLLETIETDNAGRPPLRTTVILLGDLIDRGPDSATVVRRAMLPIPWARTICLKGNHEAVMLSAIEGDTKLAQLWLRIGGDTALASWGADVTDIATLPPEDMPAAMRRHIPEHEIEWLSDRPIMYRNGDYVFVHAGIRPGVAIDTQNENDCLWIRDPFLNSRADHGATVVHGHSIGEDVDELANRIGIDTGAYFSGQLTALGLEGEDRWFLST